MLNNKDTKVLKELDKDEVNKNSEINKKLNSFYNQVNFINQSLDVIRNRLFNLAITKIYVKEIDFNYQDILDDISKNIYEIDKNYLILLNGLNISYGDKTNEITNYFKEIVSTYDTENVVEEVLKETVEKTEKKQKPKNKVTEEDILCSELKTIANTTKQNLID